MGGDRPVMDGTDKDGEKIFDAAIVGAGPVGLFAIFELGMVKLDCAVIDALDETGGQCSALYPEKPIYDIPGHPAISGADLVARLNEQAAPFKPVHYLGQRVESLSGAAGDWCLTTSKGQTIRARAVVIAAGAGAFGPNRPPLDNIAMFEGKSVFYYVKRREDFRDKRVVIAGGGDSAVDWAIALSGIARSIQLVHRRDKFRAAPESVARLQQLTRDGLVEWVVPYQLAAVEGKNGVLRAVTVADLDGNRRELAADILLPFFGLSMDLGPIASWGLDVARHHITIDPTTGATNIPGIYAIGDIATYPGKLKLILCGFSEAAMAAQAIYAQIHPNEALHFEYSTTKGLPTT